MNFRANHGGQQHGQAVQPVDVRGLSIHERDDLIVSMVRVDGQWLIKSRYGDDRWELNSTTTQRPVSESGLSLTRAPASFRPVLKAIVYRYLRRGRDGQRRPGLRSATIFLDSAIVFLRYLEGLRIARLQDVTPLVCRLYVDAIKTEHVTPTGKPLAAKTLVQRFSAVEALYELSQHTSDPMPAPPWPDTSATRLAGLGDGDRWRLGGKTPIIPDDVFVQLFQAAWRCVEKGDEVLALRDELTELAPLRRRYVLASSGADAPTNRFLEGRGWGGGLPTLNRALVDLRTACYIVVASLSGCRNHELAYVQRDACFRTEDDGGEVYWWMRSRSTKTDEGPTQWMIPQAAVTALRVMDRWAQPYQAMLTDELATRRSREPRDAEIAEAERHLGAIFVGIDSKNSSAVRTLTTTAWNQQLKAFARRQDIEWPLATHQFRSTFAHYAARSRFGDLRYLKEHFKHWSLDMTLGYAMNEAHDLSLYLEVEDALDELKAEAVNGWLAPDEPLAGGYGKNIVAWRGSDQLTFFKSHAAMVRSVADSTAIRSNGHAWCTADDNLCVGNDMERTRCSGCGNAVIGRQHAHLYQGMFDRLKELLACDDIGEGGLQRIRRDLTRCRDVLRALGYEPEVA